MRKNNWRTLGVFAFFPVAMLAIFLCTPVALAGTETQITTNASDQMFPAISGDKIVWTDNRNGNRDIYMYDLTTNTETQITTNTSDQWSPRISGDRIVWQDGRNITNDIYMYDISSNVETRITTNFAGHYSPDIDGDKIVFEEDSDIYVYDISSQVKTLVTSAANSQYVPRISGDNIVWYDYRLGFASKPDIYLYNLISQTETQITSDGFAQEAPDISGNKIVWADRRGWNQNYDIYLYDLATRTETQISTNTMDQISPRISSDRVVWNDYRNLPHIYEYNLTNQTETQITVGATNHYHPDIDGDRIVWTDHRNGSADIYMYDLQPNVSPVAQIASVPVTILGQVTNLDASGSSDSDGTITNYHWDFGDNSSADGVSVNHTYTSAGAYQVILTVTDDGGATGTATTSVLVDTPPIATISPVATVALGQTTTLDGSGSSDLDGSIVSYAWDFGDGSVGSGVTTSHVYADSGTYQITLTVTDNHDATSTATVSVRVNALPIASIAPIRTVIVGEATVLNASGSSDPDGTIMSYVWDFGDGSTGGGATMNHTYVAAGTYQAILTVTDNDGATATAVGSAVVQTPAQAIDDLIDLVQSMNLAQGIANSLDSKLQNASDALSAMNAGSTNSAIGKPQAFINAVQAQSGNQLTLEQANQLIVAANRIIAAIN
jgi:beta propeller repeat protein